VGAENWDWRAHTIIPTPKRVRRAARPQGIRRSASAGGDVRMHIGRVSPHPPRFVPWQIGGAMRMINAGSASPVAQRLCATVPSRRHSK